MEVVKKFVLFVHIPLHNWIEVGETIEETINKIENDGFKILSISFSGNGMVACIFYRMKIWKAIKDFFNVSFIDY